MASNELTDINGGKDRDSHFLLSKRALKEGRYFHMIFSDLLFSVAFKNCKLVKDTDSRN